jgi:hypothetical protein
VVGCKNVESDDTVRAGKGSEDVRRFFIGGDLNIVVAVVVVGCPTVRVFIGCTAAALGSAIFFKNWKKPLVLFYLIRTYF